jgi:tetratricopeptide (TPR) repeat protein
MRWLAAAAVGVSSAAIMVVQHRRVNLAIPQDLVIAATSSTRTPGFSERDERDTQIAVWNQALAADAKSALAMGHLAALHLQRAREGGTWDDYVQAESLARRSLQTRVKRNARTAVTLTQALLAQHRFTEALVVARELVSWEPDPVEYRALLGEVAMEVGDDSTAAAMFDYVWSARRNLSVAPRLARWLELTNQVEKARRVMTDARDAAIARRDVPKETKAWFHLRVGDIELRAGRAQAAAQAFRAGLAIEPQDPRLLAAMARVADHQGDLDAVIAWGERAIGIQMEPATLGLLASAYAARGDRAKANEYGEALAIVASSQPGPFHRAWSLYLLDRGEQIDRILTRSQEELQVRKDVYGYDLAAWAMFRAGRLREARVLMARALRFQTPDPLLAAHARMIMATPPLFAARP